MKLIIQPDEGLRPLVQAVKNAKRSIDIVIFRFDRPELEKALAAAVSRGVAVRALIAHTNRGGEKNLRKLEMRLLDAGVIVARTADDLTRYHSKMMIVDDTLFVLGFNFTRLDIERTRSFGVVKSRQAPGQRGRGALHRRLYSSAIQTWSRSVCGQPGELARAADEFSESGKKAAAHLQRQDLGSDDDPRTRGASQGRRGDQDYRQSGEGAHRRRSAKAHGPASSRSRDRPRRDDAHLSEARVFASWSWTAVGNSASSSTIRESPGRFSLSSKPTGMKAAAGPRQRRRPKTRLFLFPPLNDSGVDDGAGA